MQVSNSPKPCSPNSFVYNRLLDFDDAYASEMMPKSKWRGIILRKMEDHILVSLFGSETDTVRTYDTVEPIEAGDASELSHQAVELVLAAECLWEK